MFLIFGWQKKASPGGHVLDARCHECQRPTGWEWFRVTEWISLFFLRILPLRSRSFLVCGACGDAIALDGEDARGVEGLERMEPDLRQQWRDYLLELIEDHQLAGMSETQRNWHRDRAEREPRV